MRRRAPDPADPRYRACPHCNMVVYCNKFRYHVRHCRALGRLFGSPAELAARFRREPALRVRDILVDYPHVHFAFIEQRLLYGGLRRDELAGRIGHFHFPRPPRPGPRCTVCGVQLTHPSVPRAATRGQRPLCGWCAAAEWGGGAADGD